MLVQWGCADRQEELAWEFEEGRKQTVLSEERTRLSKAIQWKLMKEDEKQLCESSDNSGATCKSYPALNTLVEKRPTWGRDPGCEWQNLKRPREISIAPIFSL